MSLLNRFAELKVVVLGDLMLDRYIHGHASRISPEAPVPVVREEKRFDAPGGAANVVNNLAGLGAQVYPLGVVGKDEEGAIVRELLSRSNVDVSGILSYGDRPTSLKTRIISGSQHVVRLDREVTEPITAPILQSLMKRLEIMISDVDAIIFQDYNKGVITSQLIGDVLGLARRHEVMTAVDPKFNNFFEYNGVDLFKPNRKEAMSVLSRVIESDAEVEAAGHELRQRLKCRHLIITRGSQGMSLFDPDGHVEHLQTEVRDVLDVSGAGDTVITTLVLGLLTGLPLHDAGKLANISAGIVCRELGAVPVNAALLLKEWQHGN